MERTKNVEVPVEEKVRWKKLGGGSLRLGGKIIKPGQVFDAFPSQISKAFRDLVVPTNGRVDWDTAKPEPKLPPVAVTKPVYELKPRGKSKSLFDVVDGQGKALNEKALTKVIAEKLIEDLLK